jgi:pyruvate formate lyase activating enzyme
MHLPLYDYTPFTLLDFPGRIAAIVWCAGCNMRCAYCHNPAIVRGKAGQRTRAEVLAFLESRRGKLDGVVLSGGEATLWPGLPGFIAEIRAMGYAVKLDTNGTRPQAVESLLALKMLDYVALDYKAPEARYAQVTRRRDFPAFRRTLRALIDHQDAVPCEVRTTVHPDLIAESDIAAIMDDLAEAGYRGTYYLQRFRAGEGPLMDAGLDRAPRALDLTALPAPRGFRVEVR